MAELICFPQERNVGKARHVADLYLRRTPKEREIYWRTTKNRLTAVMQRLGFPHAEIEKQIDAFTGAVQDEINATHHFAPSRENDGGPGAA